MKITQQFFEEFLDGNDDILELGMRVLKLEILFRVHKGTIPLLTLFRSFTSNEIEFFLSAGIINIDAHFAYDTPNAYTEGSGVHMGSYPWSKTEATKSRIPEVKPSIRRW